MEVLDFYFLGTDCLLYTYYYRYFRGTPLLDFLYHYRLLMKVLKVGSCDYYYILMKKIETKYILLVFSSFYIKEKKIKEINDLSKKLNLIINP